MTCGTSANTYLVGRRSSRLSPDRRSRTVPIGKGPAIQHQGRGLIALTTHFAHFYLAHHLPPSLRPAPNEPPAIPASSPQPETSHPRRQDAQINYLDILTIFVKQTTYLAILPLFGHLARPFPASEKFPKKRNVTSSVRRRSAPCDLVRLLRFLRTFLQATQARQAR